MYFRALRLRYSDWMRAAAEFTSIGVGTWDMSAESRVTSVAPCRDMMFSWQIAGGITLALVVIRIVSVVMRGGCMRQGPVLRPDMRDTRAVVGQAAQVSIFPMKARSAPCAVSRA